jgi:chromosome segregation ATPase
MQSYQGSQKTRSRKLQREEMMEHDVTQLQVDVGVLQTQVANIVVLCDKMDKVMDRLVDGREKIVNQIYDDMDERKKDVNEDIKELHSRITTVDRNLTTKLESVEDKIMAEIKTLRNEVSRNNDEERNKMDKILEWKWMAAGGILVLSWLLSHKHFDTIEKLLN